MSDLKLKLKNFVQDNHLNFDDADSGLNSACVILSGYALYLGIEYYDDLEELVEDFIPVHYVEVDDELSRVFEYAKSNSYGTWWRSDRAKSMYKF